MASKFDSDLHTFPVIFHINSDLVFDDRGITVVVYRIHR